MDAWDEAFQSDEVTPASIDAWDDAFKSVDVDILTAPSEPESEYGLKTLGALGRGLIEGASTELPGMAGRAVEFLTPDAVKELGFDPGKNLADWAEHKAEEWFGPQDYTGLNYIVYEGSKMLAPSVIPGGLSFAGAKTLLKVGKLVKLGKIEEARKAAKLAATLASASVAGMFGLSQAQQTEDTANKQAEVLESQGRVEEAKQVRESGQGYVPWITGGIEATGEYFGTKYLGKLFRLDEIDVVKRGAKNLVLDFLKTLGVETGTEFGQQLGEAAVEKTTGIRPDADPLAEALNVIGPTAFMTLLTGGASAVVNIGRPTEHRGAEKLDLIIEQLKKGEIDKPEALTQIEASRASEEAKRAGSEMIRSWEPTKQETGKPIEPLTEITPEGKGKAAPRTAPATEAPTKPEGKFEAGVVEEIRKAVDADEMTLDNVREHIDFIKKDEPEQAAALEREFFPGEVPKLSKIKAPQIKDTGESLAKEFGVKHIGSESGLEWYNVKTPKGETTIATEGVNREALKKRIEETNILFEVKYAKGKGKVGSVTQLLHELTLKMAPRAVKNLLISGRVKIVQTEKELQKNLELRYSDDGERIQGAYDPKTKTSYMVADSIKSGEAWGVMLHELGTHAGLKKILGNKHSDIMKEVSRLVDEGDNAMAAAAEQVPKDTQPNDVTEETLAYFTQHTANQKHSLFKRMMSTIRTWAFKTGLSKKIESQDMAALVRGAVRREAKMGAKDIESFKKWAQIPGKEGIIDVKVDIINLEKKIVRNDDLYKIFTKHIEVGPLDGGCYAMAKALNNVQGGKLVTLLNGKDQAQHIANKIEDKYWDGDGVSTEAELLKRWEKVEGISNPSIRIFKSGDVSESPRDKSLIKEVMDHLVGRVKYSKKEKHEIGDYWYDKDKKRWMVRYPKADFDYSTEREAKLIAVDIKERFGPKFSKKTDVTTALKTLNKNAKKVGRIKVVESFEDLPEDLRKKVEARLEHPSKFGQAAPDETAVYDREKDVLYFVTNNIESIEHASKVWFREQVGRYGLLDLLTKYDIDSKIFFREVHEIVKDTQIYKDIEILFAPDTEGMNAEDKSNFLVTEILAQRAEKLSETKRKSIYQKFKDLINKWLRALFGPEVSEAHDVRIDVTDKDIDTILEAAKNYTLYGRVRDWLEFKHPFNYYKEIAKNIYKVNPEILTWWENHQDFVKSIFGADADIFNVLIAITSPEVTVSENVVYAVQCYLVLMGRDKVTDVKVGGRYPGLVEKKLKALEQGDWETARGQEPYYKIPEMIQALLGDPNATVSDRHMREMWFGELILTKIRTQRPTTLAAKQSFLSISQHTASRHQIFKLTKALTDETDRMWHPREVQAALWSDFASKLHGFPLEVTYDYRSALLKKSNVLGNRTPIEYLRDMAGSDLIGELHKHINVPPAADVSMLEVKYRQYLKKEGTKPIIKYSKTTVKDLPMGVHYKNTLIKEGDYIEGAQNPKQINTYSRNDVFARMMAHTEKNPYAPLVYFYLAGGPVEISLQHKKAHNVDFSEYDIYDAYRDPLKFMDRARSEKAKDPWSHEVNILANLIDNTGRYDGFLTASPYRDGSKWVMMLRRVAVTHMPDLFDIGVSDTIGSIETGPQSIEEAEAIISGRSLKFYKKVSATLDRYKPTISMEGFDASLAQFEGATEGKLEIGGAIKLRGPLGSIRSMLAEIGIENDQNEIYIMRSVEGTKLEPNGVLFIFKTKKEYNTIQKTIEKIKEFGLHDFNITVSEKDRSVLVKQFVFNNSSLQSIRDVTKLIKMRDAIEDKSFIDNTEYDAYSEVMRKEDYREAIVKYYGAEVGDKVFKEALIRQGKVISKILSGRTEGPRRPLYSKNVTQGADRSDVQVKYSIAGKKSRTADKISLFKAKTRLMLGADAETVRKETGWYLWADKKWRYEIDDSKVKIVLPFDPKERFKEWKMYRAMLPKVLEHPDLYQAYPELKELEVIFYESTDPHVTRPEGALSFGCLSCGIIKHTHKIIDIGGFFSGMGSLFPKFKPMRIDELVHIRLNINPKYEVKNEDLKGTVLHEVQHAIQLIEGFAQGGTTEAIEYDRANILDAKNIVNLAEKKNISVDDILKNPKMHIQLNELSKLFTKTVITEDDVIHLQEATKQDEVIKLVSNKDILEKAYNEALRVFDDYMKLAGEVEAREVSDRRNLIAEERREQPPFKEGIVDKKDLIVRRDIKFSKKSYATYNEGIKEADTFKNILVKRDGSKSTHLLIQISNAAIEHSSVSEAEVYYNDLYTHRDGYDKPEDFWEIPEWAARTAYALPDADVYVVRNIDEANQYLKKSKYEAILLSGMDANKQYIKGMLKDYKGKVVMGGYIDKGYFAHLNDFNWVSDVESACKVLGVPFKNGSDYGHFTGTATVPRLELSTGCKHNCAFCTVEKELVMRDRKNIDQQVEAFKDLKFKLVYLNDKTFGQAKNYRWLSEINKAIRKNNPEFQGFIIQTTAPAMLKMDDAWLKESGIAYVELGMESYNNDILAKINKPHRTKLIDKAVEKLRRHNIAFIPNVMVGLAGKNKDGSMWSETAKTYQNTKDFLEKNKDIISHTNSYVLAVYDGTELENQLRDDVDVSDYDENVINKSWMKDQAVHEDFYRWVLKYGSDILKEKSKAAVEQIKFTVSPPVRSEAFKKWFGDSKVVDENGEPLVVYHGTYADKDFESFRRRVGDVGIHFGSVGQANDRLDYTSSRAGADLTTKQRIVPAYLSIKNPFRFPYDAGFWNADNMNWKLKEIFPDDKAKINRLKSTKDIREYLQSKGYDGIIYKNEGEVTGANLLQTKADIAMKKLNESLRKYGKPLGQFDLSTQKTKEYQEWSAAYGAVTDYRSKNTEDSYIAFERNQIKSIWNVEPTKDPRILYSKAAPVWYSQVEKFLSSQKQEMWLPSQLVQNLQGWARKGRLKQEELDWSGVTDWLKVKRGKVSKDEVLQYLAENNVQVKEVEKGTGLTGDTAINLDDYILEENMSWTRPRIIEPKFEDLKEETKYQAEQLLENNKEDYLDEEGNVDEEKLDQDAANRAYENYFELDVLSEITENETGWYIRYSPDNTFAIYDADDKFVEQLDYNVDLNDAKNRVVELTAERDLVLTDDRVAEIQDAQEEGGTKFKKLFEKDIAGEDYRELLLMLPEREPPNTTRRKELINVAKQISDKAFIEKRSLTDEEIKRYDEIQDELKRLREEDLNVTDQNYRIPPTHQYSIDEEVNINRIANVMYETVENDNGERILRIFELQSDWHQEGRKKGYRGTWNEEQDRELNIVRMKLFEKLKTEEDNLGFDTPVEALSSIRSHKDFRVRWEISLATETLANKYRELTKKKETTKEGVPDAPFKKTWPLLVIKRMVRYAAENDFDAVAWDVGITVADRYDLSKWVSSIDVKPMGKLEVSDEGDNVKSPKGYHIVAYDLNNNMALDVVVNNESELENYIGKDATNKALQALADDELSGVSRPKAILSGLDLKIGGEGMKGFYDRILVSEVNKFFNKKEWGFAKVETAKIEGQKDRSGTIPSMYKQKVSIHQLKVTSEMQSKAMSEGMPLFAKAPAIDTPEFKKWFRDSKVVDVKGKPLVIYHGTSVTPLFDKFKTSLEEYFFTSDKEAAKEYGYQVVEVYLSMQNPKIVDYDGAEDNNIVFDIDEAKENKYDGLIALNTFDGVNQHDQYVVFKPNQIKSIFNRGTFNLKDPRIFYSKKSMGVSKETDGFFATERSTIGSIIDKIKGVSMENLKTQLADRLNPIKVLGNEVYMLHRMQGNIASQMVAFFQHGKFEWRGNGLAVKKDPVGGFMTWYSGLSKDGPKFLQWVAAKRAYELSKPTEAFPEGRENFLTEDKRDAIFATTWAMDDAHALELNRQFKEFNDNILDIAQEAGIINAEGRLQWQQEFYIPFYRMIKDEQTLEDDLILAAPSKIRRHVTSGIKQLKGGESQLGDPMENIIRNWTHLINESMRNQSRQHAFEAAKDLGMARRVPKKFLSLKERKTLSFLRDGESIYFQVSDAELFNALSEFNREHLDGMLSQMFGKAKSLLTWGVTMGPTFRIANAIRDSLSTGVNSPHFIPFIDSFRGMVKIIASHPDYIAYAGSGGAFTQGFVQGHDPAAQAEHIMSMKDKSNILRKIYKAWQYVGDVSEMMARVQLYSNIIKKGGTHLEASFEAKDIMDFTMKGANKTMTSLTNMIPFMNARIQGLYRLGRGAAASPVSFLVKGTLLTIASMGLWALWKDDDRYKDLPDSDKWLYHHMWVGDQHIRIPKGFEVGLIFSSVFEEAGNIWNKTEEGKHFLDFLGHAFRETLAMEIWLPQLIKPAVEIWMNKNTFTGRQIEGMGISRLSPGKRYDPWTAESLKALGEKTNLSPKKVEHLLRGYLGSLGAGLIIAADFAYTHVVELPDRPSTTIDQYPLLGRFVRGEGVKQTKYSSRVWKILDELNQVNSDLNRYRRDQDHIKARAFQQDKKKELRAYVMAKPYESQLDEIRSQITSLWTNKYLSIEQKDARLERLTKKRNKLHRQMYEAMQKALK